MYLSRLSVGAQELRVSPPPYQNPAGSPAPLPPPLPPCPLIQWKVCLRPPLVCSGFVVGAQWECVSVVCSVSGPLLGECVSVVCSVSG
ncbi:hypothetical protein J4Q44_G00348400, partial [Coregonus suidteri]